MYTVCAPVHVNKPRKTLESGYIWLHAIGWGVRAVVLEAN